MSLLLCLGTGTVTQVKETNTTEIMVYVPILFPTAEGRTANNVETVEKKSLNAAGEEVRSSNMRSNSVPAKWKNMGDNNRMTPPDVREGTKVAIYHTEGSNQFYWSLSGVNGETMRLESVLYGWSASPELDDNTEFNVDNFYTGKVDTRLGVVAFRTSQANGEKSGLEMQMNAKEGRVSVTGTRGTQFVLDDPEDSFTYTNKAKSYLRIEKKSATIKLDEDLNIFAKREVNLKTTTMNVEIETLNADIKTTNWKGLINHEGDKVQEGDYNLTGDVTQTGNYTSTGLGQFALDVATGAITLRTHGHTLVQNGNGVSGPPAGA